jgi:hypothetical protein
MVPKLIQSHGLRHYFEKRQGISTFHKNGCHNQPRLSHQACFGESSGRTCLEKSTFVFKKILRYFSRPQKYPDKKTDCLIFEH